MKTSKTIPGSEQNKTFPENNPNLDEALTRKMAKLARLPLTEEEGKAFTPQLGQILKYVSLLEKVDVSGTEPLIHPFESYRMDQEPQTPSSGSQSQTHWREDQILTPRKNVHGEPQILESAPELEEGGFKVPEVL